MNVQNEKRIEARACIIWLHGLGANSSDMVSLAEQLCVPVGTFKHVFLDAPMRKITINQGMLMPAWYDIVGGNLTDREDETGIVESQRQILAAVDDLLAQGFLSQQIFLAGFSQGGAMALYTALHQSSRLGGIVVLSAYLPLAHQALALLPKEVPLFLACGRFDPIVLPAWSKATVNWLVQHEYQCIAAHEYAMSHSVCHEEIGDLSSWLFKQIEGI